MKIPKSLQPPEPTIPVKEFRRLDTAALPLPKLVGSWRGGTGPTTGIAVSAERQVVAVGDHEGVVGVFSLNGRKRLASFIADGFVWGVARSADHRFVTAIGTGGQMFRWEWETGAVVTDGVRLGAQAQNARPFLIADGSHVAADLA